MTLILDISATTPAVTVGADRARDIEKAARRFMPVAGGRVDSPEWVAAARDSWADLPSELRRPLAAFRRDSGPTGSLLLRGLPVARRRCPPLRPPTARPSTRPTSQRLSW